VSASALDAVLARRVSPHAPPSRLLTMARIAELAQRASLRTTSRKEVSTGEHRDTRAAYRAAVSDLQGRVTERSGAPHTGGAPA
jgi:hypothetical protein